MTEYVKSTNFASKDSLAIGNPLKIVKGTEIDTEFNNISTAVATKADLLSPALTGTPTAPTASDGTNTTQIATTAFITTAIAAAKEAMYPVGSIYINAASATNPATLLGFGTWTEFGAGRVLVGQNASDALFDTLEETGGSKDAIVVAHTHTGTTNISSAEHTHTFSGTTNTAGAHAHNFYASQVIGGAQNQPGIDNYTGYADATFTTSVAGEHTHGFSGTTGIAAVQHSHSFTTGSTGSSETNANVQPYIVVKMWKRVS